VAYVTTREVESWLQDSKFDIGVVEPEIEALASSMCIGRISQRYDTSTWLDSDTTPSLVLNLIAMWVAAAYLRKIASEEDGLTTYADVLEARMEKICESIVDGIIDLPGYTEDPSSSLGGSAAFFPDNAATQLWEDNHTADGGSTTAGAATRAFTMEQSF